MSARPVEPPGSLFYMDQSGSVRTLTDGSIPPARLKAADRAARHADREVSPTWSDDARAYLLAYAGTQQTWMAEDVVAAWNAAKLPEPPDARSWGSVLAVLSRSGAIFKTGYRLDAYGSPKPVWSLSRAG